MNIAIGSHAIDSHKCTFNCMAVRETAKPVRWHCTARKENETETEQCGEIGENNDVFISLELAQFLQRLSCSANVMRAHNYGWRVKWVTIIRSFISARMQRENVAYAMGDKIQRPNYFIASIDTWPEPVRMRTIRCAGRKWQRSVADFSELKTSWHESIGQFLRNGAGQRRGSIEFGAIVGGLVWPHGMFQCELVRCRCLDASVALITGVFTPYFP